MGEILPITKFLLDFFGIQYTMILQTCQKQESLTLKTKTELYSIPVSTVVMTICATYLRSIGIAV